MRRLNRWIRSRRGQQSLLGLLLLLIVLGTAGQSLGLWDLRRLMGTASGTEAVQINDFAALALGQQVQVRWATTEEPNNQGFILWRSSALVGPRTRLNEVLVPSQGGNTVYEWLEPSLELGTYYYWLDDVSSYGIVQSHGPIEVQVTGEIPNQIFLPLVVLSSANE